MKRLISTSISLVLSLVIVAPASAYYYVPGNSDASAVTKSTRRATIRRADGWNRRSSYIPYAERTRRQTSVNYSIGHSLLRRAHGRRLRNLNRTVKPGSDRYRVLNIRRMQRRAERSEASLPSTLVQTGGRHYDRPTRRDVRENRQFSRVNDRDRNILYEIQNSSRF